MHKYLCSREGRKGEAEEVRPTLALSVLPGTSEWVVVVRRSVSHTPTVTDVQSIPYVNITE